MSLLDPPGGKPWALLALCGGSLVLNAILLTNIALDRRAAEPVEAADVVLAPAEEHAVEVVAVAEPAAAPAGVKAVRAAIDQNLSRTIAGAVPAEQADVVAAVYARLFFWDLDLRRDLQRGDELSLAYTWDGELAAVPVGTYTSGKHGRTLKAYSYLASGDAFPSYWDETGTEVPYRLIDGPLADYEQVTSLLKDRPKHKGMDFKAPVGTDVVTPRAGTVVRTDWNWTFNGNCVEVKFDDGTIARFLHLSETAVQPGQRVADGTRLGATGNTGRSTAPHLHYELERGGRVIDPVEYHGVTRRELGEADRSGFASERRRLDALLASAAGA
jgi:murein DD-endopeptidase